MLISVVLIYDTHTLFNKVNVDAREEVAHLQEAKELELQPPLNITWKRGKDMPFAMNYNPDVAVLKEMVYVGGGGGRTVGKGEYIVMVYDIQRDSWNILPPYSFYWFSLTVLNNQLVLVGGVDNNHVDRTNKLGVWDDKARWTHPFPPMPTARSGAMVVTHNNRWMVVAGGYSLLEGSCSEVEIFDSSARQWYLGTSLPVRGYKMSSTVIKNMWYLLGGYTRAKSRKVLYINLNHLIIQAISDLPTSSPPSEWCFLPDTPLKRSAALALNGALLAVGGKYGGSAMYLYQPRSRSWSKIKEQLCSERDECVCTVLPCGKVFIVGGNTEQIHIGIV